MQIVNDIKPVTYLKSRAADVLKYINETHRPMIITLKWLVAITLFTALVLVMLTGMYK